MLRKSEIADSTTHEPHETRWKSLAHLLVDRAARHPDRPALTFLPDDSMDGAEAEQALTYAELHRRVRAVALRLVRETGAVPGDRAMLLFPPGLEFMIGFMACEMARLIPVPTSYPKPGRAMPRLDTSVADCQPSVLISDQETIAGIDSNRLSAETAALPMVATDASIQEDLARPDSLDDELPLGEIESTDLALLQYTSGSTSDPKGVMVSHANLLSNLESIRQAFGIEWSGDDSDDYERGLFWLPPFHDMGLIGGILEPLYVGGHAILMSPRSFLARPMRWLRAISDYKATISGAPNFAYQLCVDRIDAAQADSLDLSGWELAFCGAEPINADTLQQFTDRFFNAGFRGETFCPCYGLAEATLMAASCRSGQAPRLLDVDKDELAHGRGIIVRQSSLGETVPEASQASVSGDGAVRRLVSSGRAAHTMTVLVVEPDARRVQPDGEIGEIWLAGPSVASGYWKREEVTAEVFGATLADGDPAETFLRTGDLGFVHDGEVYVSGRRKDLVILRGRNLFPQDIEATVKGLLQANVLQCAAVATTGRTGDALTIAAEVSRHVDSEELPDIVRHIRRAIIDDHEVDARQVLITRPGGIPLTTSGKVQRQQCRAMIEAGELAARYQWNRNRFIDDSESVALPELPTRVTREEVPEATEQITVWLLAWLSAHSGEQIHEDGERPVRNASLTPETPFAETGMDSLTAVELSSELEDWLGIELTPVLAFNYPTSSRLAAYLAETLAGGPEQDAAGDIQSDIEASDLSPEELEALLSEIENDS
ncbi:Long-chain-fatty-acid--CoA ligase [Rhodopirellula islandica]|uniref:Long-chain-fatty-acid--CoA ligase n=1 Tax=Rhodopirellula islandica TaxID=595434 RepID=A0A0J1BDS6_RHOIS|nr:AMP-binding protein [Rhodopirellula islandica]KLU04773.1 Long-chain-fatty-acid--CoA ligase [Rhodopirellula islandica]